MNENFFHVKWFVLLTLAAAVSVRAEPAVVALGGVDGSGWSGVTPAGDHATLALPGQTSFSTPDGPKGFYAIGFRRFNDSTIDLSHYSGLRFDLLLADDRTVHLDVSVSALRFGIKEPATFTSPMDFQGAGWHEVYLPWSAMPFNQAASAFLQFGKTVTIAATGSGSIGLRDLRFVQGRRVALRTEIQGKPAPQNGTAEYPIVVTNTTRSPEAVTLSFIKYGWQTMATTVEPSTLTLAPGETKACNVRVTVGDRMPAGGHETQVLQAVADGNADAAETMSLVTTSQLPHPYVLHTAARWQEVKDKVKRYDWAQVAAKAYIDRADKWSVPQPARLGSGPDSASAANVFGTASENDELAAAYAWELTGDPKYAEKVRTYLLRLSDPKVGYPATLQACNQSLVQEGGYFQHMAMGYDIIYDTLSEADHAQIDHTLRLLMETMSRENTHGAINNWNLAEVTGGFYCALALQDLSMAERFFHGINGICDQLAKGTMGDGWWYECSISYNMWCASEFTQAAMAYEPFGVNFKDAWVPANVSTSAMLSGELSGGNSVESDDPKMKGKPFGMDPSLYGPPGKPYRTITDLWNSLLPFIDYRGVMFGVNDSTENQVTGNRTEVSGQPFEIAYYEFRDPRYAAIIKLGQSNAGSGGRDLLYAVPELPENTPATYHENAVADDVGLAMLRSQTPDRPQREQIQAALHYGTHGWAHGHFDRTDFINLMRYGRSFWNPESVFYVYEPYMYKFFAQTSDNHNMVVVDQKMQEATPGTRLLFYSGEAMQATAVETNARWSNPPYGGMVYDYVPVKTFAEKMWREGRSVPLPASQPAYGTLTDFTEPILQRRLMIVTDDYVLLADYLKGSRAHTFDSLLHLKGFQSLAGSDKKFDHHDAQWSSDPLSSAQFVTNANWYTVNAPSVATFAERWGAGADEAGSRSIGNDPGVLKLDIHTLWPSNQQIMIASSPETLETEKRLTYRVQGDGKMLAEGKVGAWILGRGDIDVSLAGIHDLSLETQTELSKRPTLFWAGVKILTDDGHEIPLAQLPIRSENIVLSTQPDRDYGGGVVRIAGDDFSSTIAAEPKNAKSPGIVHINLDGLHAARLRCVIGSDYPVGDESQRRKTMAVRSTGSDTRYITLIEPYENDPVVHAAEATSADSIKVELTDGRVQVITLQGVTGDGRGLGASLVETRGSVTLRSESTH